MSAQSGLRRRAAFELSASVLCCMAYLACSAAGDGKRSGDGSVSGSSGASVADPEAGEGQGGGAAHGTGAGRGGSGAVDDAGAGPTRGGDAGAGGSNDGAPSDPCQLPSVVACDDCEADTLRAPWEIMVDPYSQTKGMVALSTERAHSGERAIKVSGGSGYNERALVSAPSLFPMPDNRFFARFAVYFDFEFPTHGHMSYALAADSDSPDGNEVRAGVHTQVLNWNFKGPTLGDPSLFSIDADGQWQTGVMPNTHEWHCIELEFDGQGQTVRYYLDGAEVEKLHLAEDDRVKLGSLSPSWSPTYADFRFGWQAYGTVPAVVYYDDLIISTARVACSD